MYTLARGGSIGRPLVSVRIALDTLTFGAPQIDVMNAPAWLVDEVRFALDTFNARKARE
ncbi:MAG: hypothetical protein ACJ76I_11875 [Gaiellaceae bacterium]